jgi:hypothetical protein
MATKKVIFFTAGKTATAGEIADIAKFNAAAEAQYSVSVMNGAANTKYGETNRLAPCDFVAGTIPTIYNAKDEIDPDAIPNQALTATQAIVEDAQVLDVDGGGTVALTIEDGVITGVAYTAP